MCECPYCGYENDMTDALSDGLSSSNTFDWECYKCEKEFEIFVEFEPSFISSKIEYVNCEECGSKTRDIYEQGRVYPWPIDKKRICRDCFRKAHAEEYKTQKQK